MNLFRQTSAPLAARVAGTAGACRAVCSAGVLALASALLPAPAAAAGFTFSQAGFDGGGVFSGSFSGAAGADGLLDLAELSAFAASFSGDTAVGGFTLGLADLSAFSFAVGGTVLGDGVGEGLIATAGAVDVLSGLAALGSQETVIGGAVGLTVSAEALVVAPAVVIPEPGTAWLLGAGLAALAARSWRRRQHPG